MIIRIGNLARWPLRLARKFGRGPARNGYG